MRCLPMLFVITLSLYSVVVKAELEGKKPAPQGWFYGFGFGYSESIYKGKGEDFTFIPAIGYIGEKLTVAGPFASYQLYEESAISAEMKAAVRFDGYESEDSDSLRGMDDRDKSVDGGFSLGYQPKEIARLELEYMHDLLSKHKGSETRARISRQFNRAPFFFIPEFSVSYLDNDLVDYYYGVKAQEATPTRAFYEGKGTFNYQASFNISTPIFLGGFTRIDFGYTWFGDEITDSPIVDKKESYNVRFGYTRYF